MSRLAVGASTGRPTYSPGRPAYRPGRRGVLLAGAVASVAVALGLYTRFGINGALSRDEAIYAYAGQQLAHGTPPYASIFDPKTPLASMIAGAAAALAHATGHYDLHLIRAAFCACACLAALAIYLLAVDLWGSVVGGLAAAVVFASFTGFAQDALSGPDAKTPGVLFAVLCMWLLVRRRWFWGGVAAALTLLVWQPWASYALIAALAAVVCSPRGQRWRSLGWVVAGGVLPTAVVIVYFAAEGALRQFIDAAFLFPLVGVYRPAETVPARILHIVQVVNTDYGFSGRLLWVGLAGLVVLAAARVTRARSTVRRGLADPVLVVVVASLVLEVAYAAIDFQDYPDVYPFLPYGALGVGGLVAAALHLARSAAARRAATAAVLAGSVALTAASWTWFSAAPGTGSLRVQRAAACGLDRIVGSHPLYALGSPVALVLTHRRNPDNFIYLGSGVDTWKMRHTPGGFNGWVEQVLRARPAAVVTGGWWGSDLTAQMTARLVSAGYAPHYVGAWRVLLRPAGRSRARRYGVRLTASPQPYATGLSGRELPACG